MYIYIKKTVQGYFVILNESLNGDLYNNIGNSWEDFLNNKWVLLSDEQTLFKYKNPEATVQEVWNMLLESEKPLTIESARTSKKEQVLSYYFSILRDFKYINLNIWIENNDRISKKTEALIAKDNGITTYLLTPEVKVNPATAVILLDKMSIREYNFLNILNLIFSELDKLNSIEDINTYNFLDKFLEEIVNNNDILVYLNIISKNNETLLVLSFISSQINAVNLTNKLSLDYILLYPKWESYIGKPLKKNTKVLYNNKLFKVVLDIELVLEIYPPSIDTASLYTEIVETAEGIYEDPIPYNGNMILEEGKYYILNGVIYKCTRNTEIAVYQDLSELLGIYVQIA